jgi:hypothetical protein
MYDINLRRLHFNHFCRGKAISFKYYACACVSFFKQHANPMYGIILSSVAWSVLLRISTLSHKRNDSKKNIEHKTRVLIFSTIFF